MAAFVFARSPLFPRAAPGTSFPDDSPSANDDELRVCTDKLFIGEKFFTSSGKRPYAKLIPFIASFGRKISRQMEYRAD